MNGVEERLAFENERIGDIVVRLQTARIAFLVSHSWSTNNVPFAIRIIIAKENALNTIIIVRTCHFDVRINDVR